MSRLSQLCDADACARDPKLQSDRELYLDLGYMQAHGISAETNALLHCVSEHEDPIDEFPEDKYRETESEDPDEDDEVCPSCGVLNCRHQGGRDEQL